MVHIDRHRIGQTIKLSQNQSDLVSPLEGIITDVKHSHDRHFDQVCIGEVWTYTSDWGTYDLIEKDGKRLPHEIGVYKVIDEVYADEFVQLDEDGQWWPYPYVFSGWRTSELLGFDKLELVEGLSTDYPQIKDPEEESLYLQEMAIKARIWEEGYEANKTGLQNFRNPYKVCRVCFGLSGEHDEKIHAQAS